MKAPKIKGDKSFKKPVQKLGIGGYANGPEVEEAKAKSQYYNNYQTPLTSQQPQQSYYQQSQQYDPNFRSAGNYGLTNKQAGLADVGREATNLGSTFLAAGAANKMSQNIADEKGQIDVKKSRQAGAMSGAAAGLKVGSLGLNPGALAATGGLSALAVPAGALIGGAVGFFGGKKKAENENKENMAAYEKSEATRLADEAKAKKAAFYNTNNANNMSREMTNRYAGYADGGLIKGAGTGKSDSIKAKLEAGSFVVPAENKEIGKEIMTKVLKAPSTKKANLNQKNGEPVKVSNGEISFSPIEVEKIESKLGEGVLEQLAPDADKKEDIIEGYKGGGPVTPEEKRKEAYRKQYNDLKKRADSTNATPYEKEYFKKRGPQLEKLISGLDSTNTTSKKENIDYFRGDKEPYSAKGSDIKMEPQAKADKLGVKAPSAKTVTKKQEKPAYSLSNGPFSQSTLNNIENDTSPRPTENEAVKAPETGLAGTIQTPSLTNDTLSSAPSTPPSATNDLATSLSSGLRGIADYALPGLQTYMGLKSLRDAGKRPVDKIDQDYLDGISTSRGIVERAGGIADRAAADARYGYSPEELASLNMQNNNATSAGIFAARNYSGGSAGNAFNMERTALNDSFDRGLAAKIGDRNIRTDKQRYADSRRAYADSKQDNLNALLANKADRSRQLFGDTMNAFQQNQSAGQELVGAGIQNLVGVGRYRDEQEADRLRKLKYGT